MARDKTQQNLKYLIYASKPFGFDQSVLNGILVTAKTNNQRFQITGALICRSDLYLQFLEGPASEIDRIYQNIRRDDRHVEITLLAEGGAQARLFPDWAMRDDPVRSWMWSREEIADGALENVSASEAFALFLRHAKELLWPAT